MAYAASNTGPPQRGAGSEPSGKNPGNYPSMAGSAGARSEPGGGGDRRSGSMTTKGNARKHDRGRR
jgi:hypothetical protein